MTNRELLEKTDTLLRMVEQWRAAVPAADLETGVLWDRDGRDAAVAFLTSLTADIANSEVA